MRSGHGCLSGASRFSFFRLLLVICLLVATSFSNKVFATHAAGADLTYRCLGGLVYEIDATFYRDCNGSSEPGNLTITYKSASCGQTRTVLANKVIGDNGNEITMPCATAPSTCNGGNSPGLRKWVYRATVTLPMACTDWVFSYRVCCRNCTITTIQSPCASGSELYVEAKLDNVNAPGNSSPRFGNMPVAFVCLGQNFNYNQYVYDLDGDSIAYELITPKTSAIGEVTFLQPYTTQSPMASSTPFTFNTITGDLNFTPSQLQIGVIAIRANEFRNGVLVGNTIRDIQVYTQNCFNTLPTASGINGTSVFSTNACAGQPVCFNIQTSDADSLQLVNVLHNSLIQGATISVGNGPRPQIQFCWTPQSTDIRTAPYQFTVTVFDNACPYNGMQTYLYSVFVNGPSLSLTTQDPLCFGAANGSATISVNPPSGNTVVWNTVPPQSGPTATGLSAGSYVATVTDVNGCSNSATAVLQNPPSTIAVNCIVSGTISCQSGNAGMILANASGGAIPYSYLWSNGAQSQSVSGLGPGSYTVTVTDANGCTMNSSATINAPQGVMSVTATANAPQCHGGNDGNVLVTLSGGVSPFTYLWSNGSTAAQLSNVSSGTYTVTVTDSNNCTVSASATVVQPSLMAVSVTAGNVLLCAGDSTGSLMANHSGGNGNISYLWNSGSTQNPVSGLPSGNYAVTITDQSGCTATANFSLQEPQPVQFRNVVVQQPACPGTYGSISFTASGGSAPYQYSWQTGQSGNALNGLAAGLYTCTITDHNGCVADTTFEITETANPLTLLAPSIHPVDCHQPNSGSVEVQLTGGALPYAYQWSNGAMTQEINGLTSGVYTVTVTDHNGCTVTASYTIPGDGQPFNANIQNYGNVLCFNGNNGFIDLGLDGTNTPYQFQWSNGSVTEDISQLTGGTYSVVITDGSGCDTTLSFSVTQPAQPLIPVLSVMNANCQQSGGSISVVATGGTAPYTFLWSNGVQISGIQNASSGFYMVTVTDANGCNAIIGDSVRGPVSALQVSCEFQNNVGCDASLPVIINAVAAGGNAPYSYLWNIGAASSSITVNSNGNYTVVVTDNSGCTSSTTANVTTLNNPVQVTGIVQAAQCLTGQQGQVALSVSGGHSPYSYNWNTGSTTANPGPLSPGIYDVIVTDAYGCTSSNTFTVDDQSSLLMNNQGPVVICTGESTTLSVNLYAGVTYQWYYSGTPLNGAITNQFTTPAPGFYYVIATGICGTFQSNTMEVIVKSVGNVSVSNNQIICPPESVQLFAGGGVSYEWTPAIAIDQVNISDPVVNPETTTNYSVTITNAEGCKSTLTVMVGVMCDSLFIPNGFSPNGDGTNDGYVIDGIEKYPDNKLWIYNRWGNLVYKAKNYDNHWDGVSNISGSGMGRKVQPGTYYYILDLNDGSKPKSGFLVIRH